MPPIVVNSPPTATREWVALAAMPKTPCTPLACGAHELTQPDTVVAVSLIRVQPPSRHTPFAPVRAVAHCLSKCPPQ